MMKKIASVLLGALLVVTPVLAQDETFEFLERLGFADILLWLLTFAILFGILSQVKTLPKSANTIIAMVIGFLVLMAAPAALISVIEAMSSGLLLVVLGLLVFIVFLEIAGVKLRRKTGGKHPQTGADLYEEVKFFQKHGLLTTVALLIIASLIFIGAGGLELIGLEAWPIPSVSPVGAFFFIVIIIAILWMLAESSK